MRSFGEEKNFWSVEKHKIFLDGLLKVDRPGFLQSEMKDRSVLGIKKESEVIKPG